MFIHHYLNIHNYGLKEIKTLFKNLSYRNIISPQDTQKLKNLFKNPKRNLLEIRLILKTYLVACDFDLELTMEWFANFKKQNLMDTTEIETILTKDKLIIGDLIDIENILESEGTLRWNWDETISGKKTVRDKKTGNVIKTYDMLEELKKSNGPVIQLIYKYKFPTELVSIDLGLTDKTHTKIFNAPVFYYNYNWYKILKTYKYKFNINPDFEDEYWKIMHTLEFENALISKIKLVRSIIKFRVKGFNKKTILYHIHAVDKALKKLGIHIDISNPKQITSQFAITEKLLKKRLSDKSRSLTYKLLPFLLDNSRIVKHLQLYTTELTQKGVSKDVLIKRRMRGIKCPFFKDNFGQYLDYIASNMKMDSQLVNDCFTEVYKKLGLDINHILIKFKNIPANRLSIVEGKNDKIMVKGVFTSKDITFLADNKIGKRKTHLYGKETVYHIHPEMLQRLRIYMLFDK